MIVVYHDVHSAVKLNEIYKIVRAFGVNTFVLSRVQGAAAQSGIPEVSSRAFRDGITVVVVKDLPDAIELLKPEKIVVLSDRADNELDPSKVDEKTMIVVTGTEPDVSKKDLLGTPVRVRPQGLDDIGKITVALCNIYKG